jgi:hypothetical protein
MLGQWEIRKPILWIGDEVTGDQSLGEKETVAEPKKQESMLRVRNQSGVALRLHALAAGVVVHRADRPLFRASPHL